MSLLDGRPWWAKKEKGQFAMACDGRCLDMPDGRRLVGPMGINCRPPQGVGTTIERPGLCFLLGMIPPRAIRLYEVEQLVYWWWEGDLPGPPPRIRQPRLL